MNILVVDDDEMVRRALERAFKPSGHRVLAASGGSKALELLAIHEIAAVISDYLMPEMTGLELMREVKRLYPGCARIIITGYMPERVAEALAAGEIDRFMTKPWENSELRGALESALEKRVKTDSAVKSDPAA